MIVYEATKQLFMEDVFKEVLMEKLSGEFNSKIYRHNNISEQGSWKDTSNYMYKILNSPEIPNECGIAMEYKLNSLGSRIDFIITGIGSDGEKVAIIIELKQWNTVEIVLGQEGMVKTLISRNYYDVTQHPSKQALYYSNTIKNYNENVENNAAAIYPCVCLHNYIKVEPDTLTNKKYEYYLKEAPVFIKGDADKFQEFIKEHIKYGDNKQVLYEIENGRIKPNKILADAMRSMLEGNQEFYMLEHQDVIYERAKELARKSYHDEKKRVYIVKGGPGTGKSVLAIQLLSALTNEKMFCSYVTKNSAPRNVYHKKLQDGAKEDLIIDIKTAFKSSGVFADIDNNIYDALLVDESHRLKAYNPRSRYLGESQIADIIKATKFSMFFIDETQIVEYSDLGTIKEIQRVANSLDVEEVIVDELQSQFRCNGSDGYLAWLNDVLQIKHSENYDGFDFDYTIEVIDSPNELRDIIINLNKKNNKSRIVAGYCWEWPTKHRKDPDYYDIKIPEYNFEMSWNLDDADNLFALGENTVNQVGCIHTVQGLEFEYIGVIIGNDLRYENGQIITDYTKRAKTDFSLKEGFISDLKTNYDETIKKADMIIKNTYKTLMTRGQKGCYIYCEDKNLANYLKRKINGEYCYNIEEERYSNFKVAEESEIYTYD